MKDSTKGEGGDSTGAAEPYRTPAEVSEDESSAPRNVWLWLGAAVLAAVIVILSLSWLLIGDSAEMNQTGSADIVLEEELAEYERLMETEVEYEMQLSTEPLPPGAP